MLPCVRTSNSCSALLVRPSRGARVTDSAGTLDFGMDATVLSRRKGRVEIKVELSCDPACWFDSGGWEPYCTDNGVYVRWVDTDPTNPVGST